MMSSDTIDLGARALIMEVCSLAFFFLSFSDFETTFRLMILWLIGWIWGRIPFVDRQSRFFWDSFEVAEIEIVGNGKKKRKNSLSCISSKFNLLGASISPKALTTNI